MATVNYTIATSTGLTWSGSFTVPNTSDVVTSSVPSNISAPGVSFAPAAAAQLYPSGNDSYTTWRTYSGASQYPDSGYSLDIWSIDLYNDINSGGTWNTLISHGAYNLNSVKNTLIYYYNGPTAPYWGSGGTVTFS